MELVRSARSLATICLGDRFNVAKPKLKPINKNNNKMEFKKSKLETVKNALQMAISYAKTESHIAEFSLLLIEVYSAINSEKEWEKRKEDMSSLDLCPFHFCDSNPKCEGICRHAE